MRATRLLLLALVVWLGGCAAAFRDAHPTVHIESDPAGADVRVRDRDAKPTPADVDVSRSGTTDVVITKAGYADHRGVVKKKMNGGWLAADIVTCVFPVALCIPLLVDAITGAWTDVEKQYVAKLEPATGAPPVASAKPISVAAIDVGTGGGPVQNPGAGMSDSERKAAARAAYQEGTEAQEKGDCATALPRFETAQKLFDAPTHLHHIAQCQAVVGKLVEAQETYETLAHYPLTASSPEAFRQAQESAKKELPALKQRVPTLRVQIVPAPSSLGSLIVQVNGNRMPNELVGIARPVNPGKYKITVSAAGFKPANVDVELKEGDAKPADVKLAK